MKAKAQATLVWRLDRDVTPPRNRERSSQWRLDLQWTDQYGGGTRVYHTKSVVVKTVAYQVNQNDKGEHGAGEVYLWTDAGWSSQVHSTCDPGVSMDKAEDALIAFVVTACTGHNLNVTKDAGDDDSDSTDDSVCKDCGHPLADGVCVNVDCGDEPKCPECGDSLVGVRSCGCGAYKGTAAD